MIEQVPGATTETTIPKTVQTEGVFDVNVTERPELAVALIVKGEVPRVTLFRGPNVIVCAVWLVTVKGCVTGGAGE